MKGGADMEIYAESLFLMNFSSLLVCLLPAASLVRSNSKRLVLSAIFGALWASMAFFITFENHIGKIIVLLGYILTALISFGRKIKPIAVFFTVMLILYASVMMFISFLGSNTTALIKNGIIYMNIRSEIFIAVFIISLPIVIILERIRRITSKKSIRKLKITKNGKSVTLNALHDSGNTVTEPLSGRSVIFVTKKSLKTMDIDKIITEEKPCIIPYHSLGHDGVAIGFTPDKIILDSKKEINGAVIGLCSEEQFGDCDALIGGI